MSVVYFHNPLGTVELRGAERRWGAALCADLTWGALGWEHYRGDKRFMHALMSVLHPTQRQTMPFDTLRFLLHSDGPVFEIDGKALTGWAFELNTAAALGSNPVRLLARMHAQCEMHGYIEPEDAGALADVIDEGLESGVLRLEMGWEDLKELCQKKLKHPIVTSFSVTESFPNFGLAREGGFKGDSEAYYGLTAGRKWGYALKGLRKMNEAHKIRWDFKRWGSFRFNHTRDALWLNREIEKRMAEVGG